MVLSAQKRSVSPHIRWVAASVVNSVISIS